MCDAHAVQRHVWAGERRSRAVHDRSKERRGADRVSDVRWRLRDESFDGHGSFRMYDSQQRLAVRFDGDFVSGQRHGCGRSMTCARDLSGGVHINVMEGSWCYDVPVGATLKLNLADCMATMAVVATDGQSTHRVVSRQHPCLPACSVSTAQLAAHLQQQQQQPDDPTVSSQEAESLLDPARVELPTALCWLDVRQACADMRAAVVVLRCRHRQRWRRAAVGRAR